MIPEVLMLALLTVTDPAVGPTAADSLVPPTSALYRNLAPFDLQEVVILDQENLELRLQLGSYANPLDLVNGFSHPVIELYLGGGETGVSELLPGSGMVLPEGETWTVALRLTGDHAAGWLATADGVAGFDVELQIVDDHLFVMTDLPAWPDPRIAGMTGLYSPFHQDGWRPLESTANPWAFSSSELTLPVIDVLALDSEAQLAALTGGVLPVTEINTIPNPNTFWFSLMAIGIAIAGVGLLLRGFGRRPKSAPDQVEVPTDDGHEARAEDAEPADGPGNMETEPELPAVTAAAAAAALVAADRADRSADTPEPEEPLEPETADVPPEFEVADEPHAPRVGVFRGQDDEYALPELASVDFGEFADDSNLDDSDHDDAAGVTPQTDDSLDSSADPQGSNGNVRSED